MSKDTEAVIRHLEELENLAEGVLSTKQEIVDLDRTRNGNREGLRALIKQNKQNNRNKSWICFGDMFIKLPGPTAQVMLEQDQTRLDEEINRLRKELRPKVSKLRDTEGQKEVKGFDLTSLSQDEVKVVRR